MSHFVCAISGNEPEVAVASPVSGEVFEKRLLVKYIEENGTDPITGQKLDISNLVELKQDPGIRSMQKPLATASLPSLLTGQIGTDPILGQNGTDTSNFVELKQDPGIRSMQKSISSGGGSLLAFAKLVVKWKWVLILLIVLQIVLGVLANDSTASSNWDLKMLIPFFSILTGLLAICAFIWAIIHVLVNSKFDVVLAKMEAMKSDQKRELHGEMNGIRGEMNGIRGEINGIRDGVNGLRGEMKEEMNGLRQEFKGLRVELNWKLEIMKMELHGEIKGLSGEMNAMKSDLNGRINVLQVEINGKK
ncbi:hypothetical protein niasHT_022841 [Heterodera trifolii]|uniref:Pre-mRNA-processing factor 19 n=1 Tax=Heterodera trifolii TaxID=157864 RepID=A0ABD2K7A8_9BILA